MDVEVGAPHRLEVDVLGGILPTMHFSRKLRPLSARLRFWSLKLINSGILISELNSG